MTPPTRPTDPDLFADRRALAPGVSALPPRPVRVRVWGEAMLTLSGTGKRVGRPRLWRSPCLVCDELTTAGLRQLDILWPAAARGVRGYLEVSDG